MNHSQKIPVKIIFILTFVLAALLTASSTATFAQEEAAEKVNAAPRIKTIEFKTETGRAGSVIAPGGTLGLNIVLESGDVDDFAAAWTVIDAEGKDLTRIFLDDKKSPNPTLTAPGEKVAVAGVFMVKAVLTAPDGSSAIKKAFLRLNTKKNQAPHNSIATDISSGGAPIKVEFNCQALDTDGEIESYCWDFDDIDGIDTDNCDSTEPVAIRKFERPGNYGITCIVTDDKGGTSFDRLTVAARGKEEEAKAGPNHPPSIDSCYAAVYNADDEDKVALIVKAGDEDNDNLSIEWKVPEGKLSSTTSPISIWTVPTEPGRYTAEVVVSDGASEPAGHYITISITDDADDKKKETAAKKEPAPTSTLVPVGKLPLNVAVNEKQNRVFVSNSGANTLSVIDAVSNKVVDTFDTDSIPGGIAVNRFDGKVYVANRGGMTVNVFDGLTGAEPLTTIYTGEQGLSHVAVDSRRSVYYVTHSDLASGKVVPLDTGTDAPGAAITTGAGSTGIAVNELTGSVYVANQTDNTVSVINGMTNLVEATINVCTEPTDIVINNNTNRVYVSCGGSGSVAVINGSTNSVMTTILVGMRPMGMGIDAERDLVYVANNLSGTVSVISAAINSSIGEIKVGEEPTDVAVHSGLQKIFVTLEKKNMVFIDKDVR